MGVPVPTCPPEADYCGLTAPLADKRRGEIPGWLGWISDELLEHSGLHGSIGQQCADGQEAQCLETQSAGQTGSSEP